LTRRDPTRHIAIVGATSAIAEHCARLWLAGAPQRLSLVGRDAGRLTRVAADLGVRNPAVEIGTWCADFLDATAVRDVADAIAARGIPDIVLIAHGTLPDQAVCEADTAVVRAVIEVNAVSPALFAEAFAGHLARAGRGTLALIGSVAGDRGRKSNYVYGSAKGLLARYAEGLQHRFAGTGVRVVLVKPGPTDTPMTAHMKAGGARLAPVEDVARGIVRAVARGRAVVYVPGAWRWIMLVLRHLPAVVFDRLEI
jgi:decaprenylphospho-beta-D-erythro-pentofuranosid-2-ulose 2-reductase